MSVNVNRMVEDLPQHPTRRYSLRLWDAQEKGWMSAKDASPETIQNSLDEISIITIHHTAAPVDQQLSVIAQYHIDQHDWPGIAYHLVVLPSGDVVQTQDLWIRSYHDGHNTRSVGICVKGNFLDGEPTRAQVLGMKRAIAWVIEQVGGRNLAVLPHKERGTSGDCPGRLVTYLKDKQPGPTKGPYAKWQERQRKVLEGRIENMEIAVAWANEKGNGFQHFFTQIIAKYLETGGGLKMEALLEDLVGDDDSVEAVVQRLVIQGSRANMDDNYGEGWE